MRERLLSSSASLLRSDSLTRQQEPGLSRLLLDETKSHAALPLVEPKSWLSWRRGLTCGLRVVTVASDVTTTELVTLRAARADVQTTG